MAWGPTIYAWQALGVFLTGVAIKLMDDHLDREQDRSAGLLNWSDRLGRATLPYALAALLLAGVLDLRAAASLFFASYAVGMGRGLGQQLPSGLRGYQEIGLSLVVGAAAAGLRYMGLALILMGAVQLADDILDRREDTAAQSAKRNSGAVDLTWLTERILGVLLLLVLAVLIDWAETLMVAAAWWIVSLIGRKEAPER